MSEPATQRLIIVVKPAARTIANEVAQIADPTNVGEVFDSRSVLRAIGDLSNTVVGHFAGWTMTTEQRDRLIAAFGNRAGSAPVYTTADTVPLNRNYWLFEDAGFHAAGFTFEQACAVIGMERIPTGRG